MERRKGKGLKGVAVSIVVFAVLFGLIATAQATYTIYGQVFDTDGSTPVVGADVNVTDLNTGDSVLTTTAGDGWYQVVFGFPGTPHEVAIGDTLQFIATYGSKRNTTTVSATGTGQVVNLILQEDVTPPTVEFIPPTPANESTSTTGSVSFTVNVTDSVPSSGIDIVTISVWNETGIYLDNETMYGSGEHKYYYDAQLPDGDYTYKAYAKDIAGNTGVSETRVLTVSVTGYRFSIEFVTDYNMISMPLNDISVTNASSLIDKIGADCTEALKWDKDTQAWKSYMPGMPPAYDFDIVGGDGYFMKMAGPTDVMFEGKPWEN